MYQVNPVLILSYNGLPLLKKCVESVRKQSIPTNILVIDNGSMDGADQWLADMLGIVGSVSLGKNTGVSHGWNQGLEIFFDQDDEEHVLVLNQDLQLGPSAYRELLAFDVPFVTGFPVDTPFEISPLAGKPQIGLSPYPCFSAFLIRRSAWETIGPFNEEMFAWSSDCDYHVRGYRLGVGMFKSGVPFYHEASSTLRNASDEEKKWFIERGNKDRAVFKSLYGCEPGEPAYSDLFK